MLSAATPEWKAKGLSLLNGLVEPGGADQLLRAADVMADRGHNARTKQHRLASRGGVE
jgi:hypothetical protein